MKNVTILDEKLIRMIKNTKSILLIFSVLSIIGACKRPSTKLIGVDKNNQLIYLYEHPKIGLIEFKEPFNLNKKDVKNVVFDKGTKSRILSKREIKQYDQLLLSQQIDTLPDVHFKWHVSTFFEDDNLGNGYLIGRMVDINGLEIPMTISSISLTTLDNFLISPFQDIYFHFAPEDYVFTQTIFNSLDTISANRISADVNNHHEGELFHCINDGLVDYPIVLNWKIYPTDHYFENTQN